MPTLKATPIAAFKPTTACKQTVGVSPAALSALQRGWLMGGVKGTLTGVLMGTLALALYAVWLSPSAWAQGAGKTRVSQGVIEDAAESPKPAAGKDSKPAVDAKEASGATGATGANKTQMVKTGPAASPAPSASAAAPSQKPAAPDLRVNGMALTRELRSLSAQAKGEEAKSMATASSAATANLAKTLPSTSPAPAAAAATSPHVPSMQNTAMTTPDSWLAQLTSWWKSPGSAPLWVWGAAAVLLALVLWPLSALLRKLLGIGSGEPNREAHGGYNTEKSTRPEGRRGRKDARTPSFSQGSEPFDEALAAPAAAPTPPHVQPAAAQFNKNIFNSNIYSAALEAQKSAARQTVSEAQRLASSEQAQLQNLRAVVESAKLHRVLAHASIKQM